MAELEQIPDWLKSLSPYVGTGIVGVLIGAYLKFKSDNKGHEVTDDHNHATHLEAMTQIVKTTLEGRLKSVEEELREVKTAAATLQKEHIQLQGEHFKCEAKITALNEKVQTLIDGQARMERRHADRVRELEDANRDQRELNDKLIAKMSEEDILNQVEQTARQVETNTKIIQEVGVAPSAALVVNTDAVLVNTQAICDNTDALTKQETEHEQED